MEPQKRILILGGYGNTGRPLAKCLLQKSAVAIVIAGRDLTKGHAFAETLNEVHGTNRVSAVFADAADRRSLEDAFRDVDMVVVASSTVDYTLNVARAAIAAGIDYLDVQFSTEKLETLNIMKKKILEAGCLFITDGGFHPGLPAALVRYAAPYFDQLLQANVSSTIKINWADLVFSPSTMEEFANEFLGFQSIAFKDGRWHDAGWLSMMIPAYVEFDPPFGRQYAIPMFLGEMEAVPGMVPGLQETGFFVGGFNWFTDFFITPIVMVGLKIAPERGKKAMGRLMTWSLQKFSKPPYGTVLKLEARGIKKAQAVKMDLVVAHEDGYFLTAVPSAACILQYLDGQLPASGLHFQAHVVEPVRFLGDMAEMGVTVRAVITPESC